MRWAGRIILLLLIAQILFISDSAVTDSNTSIPKVSWRKNDESIIVFYGTKKTVYNKEKPDIVLSFNFSNYRAIGNYEKFIIYEGARLFKAPNLPPIPYRSITIKGYVSSVKIVYTVYKDVYIERIARLPIAIPYMINTDYIQYVSNSEIPVTPGGYWPQSIILGIDKHNNTSIIRLGLVQYDLGSKLAKIILEVGLKISTRRVEAQGNYTYDAIIIVDPRYQEYAYNYTKLHPEKTFFIATTNWIYQNYNPAEPPPFPGFSDGGHPGYSKLSAHYNFSLALRIIAFLRSMVGKARTVVLLGNAIDVPPSYYYWDEQFYVQSRNYVQSWVPTDLFYASPDYDFNPEFFVGRIPFLSTRDLDIYFRKIETWINASKSNASWLRIANVVGGMPFGTLYYSGEATIIKIINEGYLGNLTIRKFFETNGMYNETIVKKLFRTPSLFLLEFSHGSETALYKLNKYSYRWIRLIDTGYLSGLDWSDGYPIVVAPACSSGIFDYGVFSGSLKTSFGQAVIFSRSGGIAYIGMSRIAYGALTFYFDRGVLRIPLLAYAQGILENVFRAYVEGTKLLGGLYSEALRLYAEEYDMSFWINLRTIFQVTLLGDPLLELPTVSSDEGYISVNVSNPKEIGVPLLFGEAIYYDEKPVRLSVKATRNISLTVFSPQEPTSYRVPFINTSYVEPRDIAFIPPSSGLYVLRIQDKYGLEQRVYVRGIGAKINNAKLEFVDSNNNGKVDSLRLILNVTISYVSISSIVWGFRIWTRMGFVGESGERVNRNDWYKSTRIGEQIIELILDGASFVGGSGVLWVKIYFFSWWPYLMTWWMSGPAIWTEFAIYGYIKTKDIAFESSVEIKYGVKGLIDTDFDGKYEGIDLSFSAKMNIGGSSSIIIYLYFNMREISPTGGRSYVYSAFYPYSFLGGQKEVSFEYVWTLDSWFARGSWGSIDSNNVKREYYIMYIVYLESEEGRKLIYNSGYKQIPQLTNVSFDSSQNKTISIDTLSAENITDFDGEPIGVAISFTGHSNAGVFERTKIILEKRLNNSWEIIYSKELTAGIFKFFWPVKPRKFVVGFFPYDLLGNGSFRARIEVFDYVGGQKVILAEKEIEFNFSGHSILSEGIVSFEDLDSDGFSGHLSIRLALNGYFQKVTTKIAIETPYETKSTTITKYHTDTINLTMPLAIKGNYNGTINISATLSISIPNSLTSVPIEILTKTTMGAIENYIFDGGKGYKQTIIICYDKMKNKSTSVLEVFVSSVYSAEKILNISINNVLLDKIEARNITIKKYALMLSEGVNTLIIQTESDSYPIRIIVDLHAPNITAVAKTPSKIIEVSWSTSDISGIKSIDILLNGTKLYTTSKTKGRIMLDASEGIYNVTLLAKDFVGWESRWIAFVLIDKTPPTITVRKEDLGWGIRLDIEISDNIGISRAWLIINSSYIVIGTYYTLIVDKKPLEIYIYALDTAGNIKISQVQITSQRFKKQKLLVETPHIDIHQLSIIMILLAIPIFLAMTNFMDKQRSLRRS